MKPFSLHKGIVAPLERNNVDTDLIIPKQFLKSVQRTGFGENLFDQLRYVDEGEPGMNNADRTIQKDFVLNQPCYSDATILLTRENFGCGSSREHAVWALADFGFRVILAPSFADIFYSNCFNNGLLPVRLRIEEIEELFLLADAEAPLILSVDLERYSVQLPDGKHLAFRVEDELRTKLLNGLDDIGITLEKKEQIAHFARKRQELMPWLYGNS